MGVMASAMVILDLVILVMGLDSGNVFVSAAESMVDSSVGFLVFLM